jgi:CDP-diacylglycerol---glycerol-3-phosphate 3-phosphatidyltransferase
MDKNMASTPTTKQEKLTLTDRLRIMTAGFIDPIVTFLAKLRVTPDMLTMLGLAAHGLFAWLIIEGEMFWAGVAVALLSPLDALDGSLARKLNKSQSNFGSFFDSTLDRFAEIILYAGYVIYFANAENSWMVAAAYLALTGSLMVSYTRSKAESLGLSCKVGIMSRVERYIIIVVSLVLNLPEYGLVILATGTYITAFQRMYHVWKQTH